MVRIFLLALKYKVSFEKSVNIIQYNDNMTLRFLKV